MDGGAWWATVDGVTKSQTQLSDFTFTFHFHALEKEMATHSSVLTWRIPGMAEPGGLLSMGLHRVRHDWSDLAAAICNHISSLEFFSLMLSQILLSCPETRPNNSICFTKPFPVLPDVLYQLLFIYLSYSLYHSRGEYYLVLSALNSLW